MPEIMGPSAPFKSCATALISDRYVCHDPHPGVLPKSTIYPQLPLARCCAHPATTSLTGSPRSKYTKAAMPNRYAIRRDSWDYERLPMVERVVAAQDHRSLEMPLPLAARDKNARRHERHQPRLASLSQKSSGCFVLRKGNPRHHPVCATESLRVANVYIS